jgi:hypothetical protein
MDADASADEVETAKGLVMEGRRLIDTSADAVQIVLDTAEDFPDPLTQVIACMKLSDAH